MMRMNYEAQRRRDIVAAYDEALQYYYNNAESFTQQEVVQRALKEGTARYYVSFDHAKRYVSRVIHSQPISVRNVRRRAMYYDLARAVKLYMLRHHNTAFYLALSRVLAESYAPEFYVSVNRAGVIINEVKREEKNAKIKRLESRCALYADIDIDSLHRA